jgi:hypothetical protein
MAGSSPSRLPACASTVGQGGLLHSILGMSCWTAWPSIFAQMSNCADNGRILLANLLQSSSSTFSWGSFLGFFAFKEGMWDT